jgi:hypothetical protein
MNELIVAGEALAHVLERENAALDGMEFGNLAPVVAEKAEAIAGFARAREAVQSVPASGRAEVAALHKRLGGLMAENRRLLARGLAAQSGLVEVIACLLADTDSLTGYGPPAPRRVAPLAVSAQA